MLDNDYSLSDLAKATGIEPRTIRSYIERGLLSGAQARGRAATYSKEHLSRLFAISYLRRARPSISLSEIRVVLQGLNPEQIHAFADGSITAATLPNDEPLPLPADVESSAADEDEIRRTINWERSAAKLTGAERLVSLLREVSGLRRSASVSKIEGWQRISVTPDVELSVRANFDANQLACFQQLADLLRHLLLHTDAVLRKGDE
jgi:DNA-binding transcriptional MerR regulator